MTPDVNWQHFYDLIASFLVNKGLGLLISLSVIFLTGKAALILSKNHITENYKRLRTIKIIRYATWGTALLWITTMFYFHTGDDAPFFLFIIGLILTAIAISLRDFFSNFVGWFIIMSERGFQTSDRITIGELTGDVIDIGVMRSTIAEIGNWVEADQSTGRLVSVPNSQILKTNIYNYSKAYNFIWNEIKILITFESNWRKAESILNEIAIKDFENNRDKIRDKLKQAQDQYILTYNYISPIIYVRIADSGVQLSIRYMVEVRKRRTSEDKLCRNILDSFAKESDIDFAYPTIRYYRKNEG